MYALYNELHPPTVVEHCCNCNFFSGKEKNLVVAGTTQLRVFRLIEVAENDVKGEAADKGKKKLEQLAEYSLFGNITSMKPVRIGSNSRDSLILSFKDAKLAVVEYDPASHDLKTVSMHYFENEDLKGGFMENIFDPIVRVDVENRCAVMLVYARHLVVLPFKQELTVDDAEQSQLGDKSGSVLATYTIDLRTIDEQLTNVTDFQFLHGYYEPTLLFLYEPVKTYAGRVAVRQDTHCIATISLNTSEKVNPIIWSLTGLPFDCHTAVPVMKPLGGVLLFANNSLIYLNQSVPPYGVSLNSITDYSTSFPLKIQDVVLTLEGALASFISNEILVLSLKGGELYVLTLITDGLRSVQSFNFDKAAGSVLASSMCTVCDGFIFLGSRLGNSLLLKYTEKALEPEKPEPVPTPKDGPSPPPPLKRRKVDPKNPNIFDDLDDLEVYGLSTDRGSGLTLVSYSFEVCDSLLNIGPCAESAVGEPAFLSEEFSGSSQPDLEVVFCSGYGKNGALSVLQRSVRPQVVTTFELPGCTDMWTVFSDAQQSDDADDIYHSFLILSREDSSMVLKTEAEINEIDNSGFSTQYPTVFTGNIGNNRYIVQVCPMSVRLLQGVKQLQEVALDSGSFVFCSIADPHFILTTTDGSIMYGKLVEDLSGARLKIQKSSIDKASKIAACCIYKDTSGLFSTEASEPITQSNAQLTRMTSFSKKQQDLKSAMEIDEDEFLYGDSNMELEIPKEDTFEEEISSPELQNSSAKPTYWVAVCRDKGGLEIYTIPDFRLVFFCPTLSNATKLLIDIGNPKPQNGSQSKDSVISEIMIVGLGNKESRPHLFVILDQDLVIYEAFPFYSTPVEKHLLLRFRKVSVHLLMREKAEARLAKLAEKGEANERKLKVPVLRAFTDISSYTGVFICGPYPHWIFMTSRGCLNAHPMTIDGSVPCFVPFHNVNCPKGFLYFNKSGELRIAVLPTHLTYDAPWPIRKVPLRATPYSVAYNRENKVYAVATTTLEPNKKIPKFNTEDKEWETLERDSRYIYPMLERFYIQLVSPARWDIVPHINYEFEEFEHISSMKTLELKSQETHSGYKTFLVAGTVYNFGEDLTSKGRVHIFDIIEVVPEPGQPLTKHKFKCLYSKEQKGPVTSVCSIQGYLLTALGQKIYVWNFKDNAELIGMAFIDTQVYVHNMLSMKNLVLTSDIVKSVQLLRFQEQYNNLSLVSRDAKPLEVYSSEYFVDGTILGFLVSDADKNLILFTYQPEALESFGGQRLLQKGDICIGAHANTMFRIKVCEEPSIDMHKSKDNRHATYLATLDGGISLVLPVMEKTYRRLLMLQNKLVECLQHIAGLNPKAYRATHLAKRPLTNAHRNILDGKLISKYLGLNFSERLELARKIGTTSSQILDDLMDIQRATSHF